MSYHLGADYFEDLDGTFVSQPAPPAAVAPTFISLYKGGALDLSTQTGTSLFQNVVLPLLPNSQAKWKIFTSSLLTSTTKHKLVIGMPLGMPFLPSSLV